MVVDEASNTDENPLAGTRYRALRLLGAGTTAEVFDALGPGARRVAVKVLRPTFLGVREAVLRLEREALALASLDHPNVVRVLDVGMTPDRRPFFVMPRLAGETLRQRLDREGPLPATHACALLAGMLEGLDVAHQKGIVHRDLKPANLFLALPPRHLDGAGVPRASDGTERLLLLDFGIAKQAGAPFALSTSAHVIGTPRYLAPEQILGGRVDARTDVYAAGLVLFEMLTGMSPFAVKGPIEVMRAHLESAPMRVVEKVGVSRELDHAVARALEKRPDRRWPSARAFAAVIDRASRRELCREAA